MMRLTTSSLAVLLAIVLAPSAGQTQEPRRPDVVFVPTPMDVVEAMLTVARVTKDDRLFDLGSGDGRIVITAAKRLGTRGVGIDIDPQRITESRHNADTAGVTRLVEFRQADLFETDLRSASVVTLYLLPQLNVRLRPKLFAELRPGSRVVSHAFDMGDWTADSSLQVGGRQVYYWVIPAKLDGAWTLSVPAGGANRSYDVQLQQTYQRLTGTATANGRTLQIENARVWGDSVMFTVIEPGGGANAQQRMQFAGRLNGDAIAGGGTGGWRATRRARP